MKPKTVRKPVKSTRPAAKTTRKANPTLKLLKMIVQALDAKKADDLRILDVSKQSTITDYLVLATGTSEPHLRALRITLEKALDEQKVRILGMDTGMASGWMVVDAFEVMVHLFTPENRDKYRMELLWKDATDLPLKSSSIELFQAGDCGIDGIIYHSAPAIWNRHCLGRMNRFHTVLIVPEWANFGSDTQVFYGLFTEITLVGIS